MRSRARLLALEKRSCQLARPRPSPPEPPDLAPYDAIVSAWLDGRVPQPTPAALRLEPYRDAFLSHVRRQR
jgi:hypothetical protein